MMRFVVALQTGLELARVVAALPGVETGRLAAGPKSLLKRLRRLGQRAPRRDAPARARLRRAIRWVDAALPGPRSCYRRSLLEIRLDRGASAEPFRIRGFDAATPILAGHLPPGYIDNGPRSTN